MFGWPRPKCPVQPELKLWIERRMAWLTDHFGWEYCLNRTIVLPCHEAFRDSYEPTEEGVLRLLQFLCDHAGVREQEVKTFIEPGGNEAEVQSLYGFHGLRMDDDGRYRTSLSGWHQEDLGRVAAGLAHSISRYVLLHDGICLGDEPDFDAVAELLSITLGFGVLAANAVLRDCTSKVGALEAWSISRIGKLDHRAYGYALGVGAWNRGERGQKWPNSLRQDVFAAFRQTEKYLRITGDSTFARELPLNEDWLVPFPGNVRSTAGVQQQPASENVESGSVDEEIPVAHVPSDEAFSYGVLAANGGDYVEAVRCFTIAIQEEPDDEEAYLQRGEAYLALQEFHRALNDARESIRLDPDDLDGTFLRGRAFLHLGFLADATSDFEHLIREERRGIEAIARKWRGHYWLGRIFVVQGETQNALKSLSRAVNFAPTEVEPFIHRSRLYEQIGRPDEAQADREVAFQLDAETAEREFGPPL